MKRFSLLVIVLIFTIQGSGQSGYYSKGDITSAGIELVDMGLSNSCFCAVKNGKDVIKYTPFEVSQYGFDRGQHYKAFDMVIDEKTERYFFEQIVEGDIKLYLLRLKGRINRYFILYGDSTALTEVNLNKSEVQNILGAFVENCPQVAINLEYIKPNKHSLKRYLTELNSCSGYPYPKVQYGIKIGIAGTQFFPVDERSNYARPDYNTDISFTVGAFIDMPILTSDFSFAPEVYFKGNHYSSSFNNLNESFDLIINYSSLNFPLLFKYRFLRDGNIPFIQSGPVVSRLVKDNTTLYKYETTGNDTFIEINDSPVIHKYMLGFSIGSGIISDIGNRYKWFGEVRYNYLLNHNSKEKNFNLGDFSINTGILF